MVHVIIWEMLIERGDNLKIEVVINLFEVGLLILGVSSLLLIKSNEERKRSRRS